MLQSWHSAVVAPLRDQAALVLGEVWLTTRALQRLLQNPLALAVLEGEYREGDVVRVDRARDGSGLAFERIAGGAPASVGA